MIKAACHCGAIGIEIATPPQNVTDCNCSICRRYGVLWAYYSPREVRFANRERATDVYMWGDRALEFHRCRQCGCVTHWAAVDKSTDRMAINARLLPPEILAGARVRRFDGANTWQYLDP